MSSGSDDSQSSLAGDRSISQKPQDGSHYHDWPNAQGFDVLYEERKPIELEIEGTIPAYAAGVLFRTGLGPRHVYSNDTGRLVQKINHWFDSLAQVHRFQIHAPTDKSDTVRVTYNSRITSDKHIERIQKTGELEKITFAARYDPCKSLFNKVQAFFEPSVPINSSDLHHAITISVNYPGISPTGEAQQSAYGNAVETICNKTDINRLQMLDPETLEPLGIANQTVLHPALKGIASGAHAKADPITSDVYNYNLDIAGPRSTYQVFRTDAKTGNTCILAVIKHAPAYLHSIFLSENHVILCVWNSHFKAGGVSILWNRNFVDSMFHNDKVPATWYVIDKRDPGFGGEGCIAKYESDPFFAFHTINAYEEPSTAPDAKSGDIDIVADIPTWADMSVLHKFYIDNLLSNHQTAQNQMEEVLRQGDKLGYRPTVRRYRLYRIPRFQSTWQASDETGGAIDRQRPKQKNKQHARVHLEHQVPPADSPELPTLNFSHFCKPYRYVYGIMLADGTKSTFVDGLVKFDWLTKSKKTWTREGHTPGEAIFVPNPAATAAATTAEDDGVLLSVVLDGHKNSSYLLVLDAQTMTEIGQAKVPGVVGFGFHGTFTTLPVRGAASSPEGVDPYIPILSF